MHTNEDLFAKYSNKLKINGRPGLQVAVFLARTNGALVCFYISVRKKDHSHNDCLIVCVLTHGKAGYLYARDYFYKRELLWEDYFTPDQCESLAGKPKIFFIQVMIGTY